MPRVRDDFLLQTRAVHTLSQLRRARAHLRLPQPFALTWNRPLVHLHTDTGGAAQAQ